MGGPSSSDYDYSSSATTRSAEYYAKEDNRQYRKPSEGLPPPVGKEIESKNKYCLVFLLDVTGSMKDWPKLILNKMPTFYVEANNAIQGITPKYAEKHTDKLEDLLDISIVAIGDSRAGDYYPIQVTDFVKGEELENAIHKIYPEGGGGPAWRESYDLAIYYAVNHCKSKDKTPICLIAEDEGYYESIKPSEIKEYIGDEISQEIKTEHMLKKLSKKFETYVLRKHYGGEYENRIVTQWKKGVGEERVVKMNDPKRLVDAAIVAAAHAKGHIDVGLEWIERRQTESQVSEIKQYFSHLIKNKKTKKIKSKDLNKIMDELHPLRHKK